MGSTSHDGVFLRDSPSGRCAFIVFLPAKQFEDVRLLFGQHRLQRCPDPAPDMAVPYRMAPNYECTQTMPFILEFLPIHDA
jgi:hypothetical protein